MFAYRKTIWNSRGLLSYPALLQRHVQDVLPGVLVEKVLKLGGRVDVQILFEGAALVRDKAV